MKLDVTMRRDLNVPTIDELSKTDGLKEIEDLVKIDDVPAKASNPQQSGSQIDQPVNDNPSKSEGSVYSNKG